MIFGLSNPEYIKNLQDKHSRKDKKADLGYQ